MARRQRDIDADEARGAATDAFEPVRQARASAKLGTDSNVRAQHEKLAGDTAIRGDGKRAHGTPAAGKGNSIGGGGSSLGLI